MAQVEALHEAESGLADTRWEATDQEMGRELDVASRQKPKKQSKQSRADLKTHSAMQSPRTLAMFLTSQHWARRPRPHSERPLPAATPQRPQAR